MQALFILGHGDDQVLWRHFAWENKASGCTVVKRQAGNGSMKLWECSPEKPTFPDGKTVKQGFSHHWRSTATTQH